MLRGIVLLIALIFAVKIPSFGQILVFEGDTLSCYNDYELGIITKASEKINELDTLLKEEREQTAYLKAQLDEYEGIRLNDQRIIRGKEVMVEERNNIIAVQQDQIEILKKEVKKQKRLKVIGAGIFAATTIYFIFK